MEPYVFNQTFHLEHTHWWFRGLHELVMAVLQDYFPDSHRVQLLDAGCGTGGFLVRLQDVWPQSLGTDLSYEAIAFCRQRGLDRIFRGTVINVPIRDGAIDGIVCLDALYHRQVSNDLTALREFYRLLKPGGMLVMNLPAFAFLNGSHDRAVHTRERYTVHQLRDRLQGAGFQVFRLTYRNLLLFPILLVKRGWDRHRVGASDLSLLSGWLNTFLFRISQFESWVLEHTDLPLGTSVFCVAKKPR